MSTLIHKSSLAQTVDAINAAAFAGLRPAIRERNQVARWIAARQGLPGSYGGTFAGFPAERARGIVLFSGERITSASARHILGEEASRVLRQLQVHDAHVTRALEAADEGMLRCLARAAADPRHRNPGLFSCGKCTVGLWRNLLSGGLDRREERIRRGSSHLRSVRDGTHGWSKCPFWYTVLAQRDGHACSEGGIEVRRAGAGTRRGAAHRRRRLRAAAARAGEAGAQSTVSAEGCRPAAEPGQLCITKNFMYYP